MNTLALETFTGDWRAVVAAIEASGEPLALTLDGVACGILLPAHEVRRAIARYTPSTLSTPIPVPTGPDTSRDYLQMLRDDPTLVPVVDGQPLEFMTMMNSSHINPEQIYQFKHPKTRRMYVYRASELQQAIGRWFSNVDFIPAHPKDFVEGK